jgi:transcriptional regulator with XRE-family HTH domain
VSDNELGAYLRARREAITPAEVGLPTGSRRRTPGLRRSELATVAGISVDYLTRLEQGRDRHPSPQVLRALGNALRLSTSDREHLRLLLARNKRTDLCPAGEPLRSVRPGVQAILDQLEPAPAFVTNRLSDILAYTTGYERLARPLGLLDAPQPNLIRFVFTDPRAHAAYPDWDVVADRRVANLRIQPCTADQPVAQLIKELRSSAGAAFTDRIQAAPAAPERTGIERLRHPEVGELRLAFETLGLPDSDDQRLVIHLPADEAASAALDRLTGRRPGALRAVSG